MRRWAWCLLLSVLLGLQGCGGAKKETWKYTGQFDTAVATTDRIVIRDGGFPDSYSTGVEPTLFEVGDVQEVKEVVRHLEFEELQMISRCHCAGFPEMDFYSGAERLALTSVQHGKAIRWDAWPVDIALTTASQTWLVQWLVRHGVAETDIEGGCGGPGIWQRRDAADRKLAQECFAEGEAHVAKGDLDHAIDSFRGAVRLHRDFPMAHYRLALAREEKGDLDQAIHDLTIAIEQARRSSEASRPAANESTMDSSSPKESPENLGEFYNARGRCYEKKGQIAESQKDFAEAHKVSGRLRPAEPQSSPLADP
jgi:tetratricopeptide (TPR) repeat protein